MYTGITNFTGQITNTLQSHPLQTNTLQTNTLQTNTLQTNTLQTNTLQTNTLHSNTPKNTYQINFTNQSEKVPLVNRFTQPFPITYGFDQGPTAEFIAFTRSNEIRAISAQIKTIGSYPSRLAEFLELLSISTDTIGLERIFLYSMSRDELTASISKFPYLEPLVTEISDNEKFAFQLSADYIVENIDPSSNRKLNFWDLMSYNKKFIASLSKCDRPIIRLSVGNIIFKDPSTQGITIASRYVGHANQVIINRDQKTAFILESCINSGPESQIFERIKESSIEVFLQKYLDKDIKVERYDLNIDPIVKLQGNSYLCATWSLYLFILYVLNPQLNRTDLYRIFNEYTQDERDLVILQFMYYVNSLNISKMYSVGVNCDEIIPVL
jgi:hypothetical protein